MLSRAEALARVPTLEPQGLRGGILYHDGQFDDARLAITLLRTLLDLGGTALNYAPVTALLKQGGRISGVAGARRGDRRGARDRGPGGHQRHGRLRRFHPPARRSRSASPLVTPSQGAHLVLDRAFLPGDTALMVPKTDDGRVLFAIPWHDRTLIGTTDTPVDRTAVEPRPLAEEVEFLLRHAARYLTRDPQPGDVLSAFAGLRPLVRAGAGDRDRQDLARAHDRRLGVGPGHDRRRQVDHVPPDGCRGRRPTRPRSAGSPPGRAPPRRSRSTAGKPARRTDSPLSVHGADRPALEALCAERPDWDRPLHPRLPYRGGEVVWAARHEQARTVEDVLARRTRALFLDARASAEAAPGVAELLADGPRQGRRLASGAGRAVS